MQNLFIVAGMKCANIKWIFETMSLLIKAEIRQREEDCFFIKFFFTNEQKKYEWTEKVWEKKCFLFNLIILCFMWKIGWWPYKTQETNSAVLFVIVKLFQKSFIEINTKWKHMCGEFNQKK